MARKGRARRFREARALKQGYDDGLFNEGDATLADLDDEGGEAVTGTWDEHDDEPDHADWDEEDPLRQDDTTRAS